MAKAAPKNQETLEFSSIAENVLNGRLDKLPNVVTLNLKNATASDYQALLQLVRHHSFGHQVLKAEPGASPLQAIRALINAGQFSQALSEARLLDANDPETHIELARAHVFLGRFKEVPDLLVSIVSDSSAAASTRGVAAQLTGHALLETGKISEAEQMLKIAQTLAQTAGNVVGSISGKFLSLARLRLPTEI